MIKKKKEKEKPCVSLWISSEELFFSFPTLTSHCPQVEMSKNVRPKEVKKNEGEEKKLF